MEEVKKELNENEVEKATGGVDTAVDATPEEEVKTETSEEVSEKSAE